MTTTFHIIDGHKGESRTDFKKRVFDLCERLSTSDDNVEVKATLTEDAPPVLSIIPFSRKKVAAVRVVRKEGSTPHPIDSQDSLRGSYQVQEALPVAYDKDWPNKTRTPGACLLTLFRKKKSIDQTTFLDRWYNGHTPLSLELHPLWHYSRNQVTGSQEASIAYDGIVEEHCREKSQLLNPFKFFGAPLVIVQNMIKVYVDVKSFIDYPSIETYLVSEYYFK